MIVTYAREASKRDRSIFLAGPTPRNGEVESWRPEALRLLDEFGFDGEVFVPEDRDGAAFDESYYDDQVDWEWEQLDRASIIVFWVPRNMATLPGLTTNVEFGMYASSGKVILGFPVESEHNRYLARLALRYSIPLFNSLPVVIDRAVWRFR